MEIYDAMESYIFSKGTEGREISAQFLPLIKTVADCYSRDRKREEILRLIAWLFPDREYMETIYPALENTSILLPYFWLIRLGRYFVRLIGNKLGDKFRISKKTVFLLMWKRYQKVKVREKEEKEEKEEMEENTGEEDIREKTAEIPK